MRARGLIGGAVVVALAAVLPAGPAAGEPDPGTSGIERSAATTRVRFADLPPALPGDEARSPADPAPLEADAAAAAPETVPPPPADPSGGDPGGRAGPAPNRSFEALGYTGWNPPDTNGAVGPLHLMTALNGGVLVQSRSGVPAGPEVSLSGFFGREAQGDVFDPFLVYDPHHDRWVLVAVAAADRPESSLLVAVSESHDPTGSWDIVEIDADPADEYWADRPSVGLDAVRVTVSINMYDRSTPPDRTDRPQIYTFPADDLYDGDGSVSWTEWNALTDTSLYGTSMAPSVSFDPGETTTYLAKTWNGPTGTLRLYSITGPAGAPVLQAGPFSSVGTENGWRQVCGDVAPQLGPDAPPIDIGDARVQKLVLRNGDLWAVNTACYPKVGLPDRAGIVWWRLEPNGTIVEWGRLINENGSVWRAYPSIAVNAAGDVLIGYARFSETRYAHGAYSFRPEGGEFSERVLKGGESAFDLRRLDRSGRNRWGDYSSAWVDPLNDADLWTIQEYAAALTDTWSTWWGMVKRSPSNDGFATPLPLGPAPASVSQATVGAGLDWGEQGSCEGRPIEATVWFEFTAGVSAIHRFDTRGSTFDTVVAVATGPSVDALTEVGCSDGVGAPAVLDVELDAGVTYRVRVGGGGGATGDLALGVAPLCGTEMATLTGSVVTGTPGPDVIAGTDGPDLLDGGGGDDAICGYGDGDTLLGGDGADTIRGGGGADEIRGGTGDDTLLGERGDDALYGDDGWDVLKGNTGDDKLSGGDGTDRFLAWPGADLVIGGPGADVADYRAAPAGVVVDLAAGTGTVAGSGEVASLRAVRKVEGSAFDDLIAGDAAPNVLKGKQGDDAIDGREGADTVNGGQGDDVIFGKGDDDTLRGAAGADRLEGGGGNDVLRGGRGDDDLFGEDGDDDLNGFEGIDALDGGPGRDRCVRFTSAVACEL